MLSVSLLSTSDSSNNYEMPSSGNWHYGWKIKNSEFSELQCSHNVRRLSRKSQGTQHVVILMAGIYFRDTMDQAESGRIHVRLPYVLSLLWRSHNILFPQQLKCSNICVIFLLRHLPRDSAPIVFIGSLSGRHPLPSMQENSRLQKDSRCSV